MNFRRVKKKITKKRRKNVHWSIRLLSDQSCILIMNPDDISNTKNNAMNEHEKKMISSSRNISIWNSLTHVKLDAIIGRRTEKQKKVRHRFNAGLFQHFYSAANRVLHNSHIKTFVSSKRLKYRTNISKIQNDKENKILMKAWLRPIELLMTKHTENEINQQTFKIKCNLIFISSIDEDKTKWR